MKPSDNSSNQTDESEPSSNQVHGSTFSPTKAGQANNGLTSNVLPGKVASFMTEPGATGAASAPVLDGMAVGQTTSSKASMPNSKSSKRKMSMMIALAVFLIAGGSAAAYQGYIVPNKPNNVVTKVLANTVSRSGPSGFAVNVDSSSSGDTTPTTSATINGSIDKDNNVRADLGVSVSAFKLTASTILRTNDKAFYIKINELPSLLKLLGSEANAALSSIAGKLDKNWLKIDTESLKQAGLINDQQAKTSTSCLDAYRSYFSTQRSQINVMVADAYKKHMFINATKAGSEAIDGVKTTKYKLDIKQSVAKDFVNELDNVATKSNKNLETACGALTNPDTKADTMLNQDATSAKLENVFMWVTGDKKLAKLSGTISEKGSRVDVAMKLNNKILDATAPTNVITVKDLMQDYQKLLGGAGTGLVPPTSLLTL